MNMLIDPLPEFVEIDGTAWEINSCFTVGVQFELLMQNAELTSEQKTTQALALYYPKIPTDIAAALERLLWFYGCGRAADHADTEEGSGSKIETGTRSSRRPPKAYCFEQDAQLIFAAFWASYRIDLNTVENLHWWKFRALFSGLPADCRLVGVMEYRTADTAGMPKKQKQYYERMKKLYALKNQINAAAALTLAERDQRMKAYVAQRFQEVGERK